jgi:23S rRNA pseudouridine1911/1915/1917 synthase
MPLPASSEAPEYSRWDEDDLDGEGVGSDVAGPGVTTIVADDEADGGRLDKWLAAQLPAYSRARIQRWIADGHVTIAERIAGPRDPVWKGDRIRVEPQASEADNAFVAEDIALDVVHEDDALFVIDKRAGLVVHPAAGNWHGTLLNGLLHRDPALARVPRAGIVHRLDKDTSGLMVVARTVVAQTDLVRQLQARTVGRTYLALVHGTPPHEGRVDWPIGRDPRDRTRMKAFKPAPAASTAQGGRPGTKPAATRFRTVAAVAPTAGRSISLVVCRLETGRTHQIRVHLQAIGHPLIGDATYGGASGPVVFARQALHAWRLQLIHPTTGHSMNWQADAPADFTALATGLGLDLDLLDASIPVDD